MYATAAAYLRGLAEPGRACASQEPTDSRFRGLPHTLRACLLAIMAALGLRFCTGPKDTICGTSNDSTRIPSGACLRAVRGRAGMLPRIGICRDGVAGDVAGAVWQHAGQPAPLVIDPDNARPRRPLAPGLHGRLPGDRRERSAVAAVLSVVSNGTMYMTDDRDKPVLGHRRRNGEDQVALNTHDKVADIRNLASSRTAEFALLRRARSRPDART